MEEGITEITLTVPLKSLVKECRVSSSVEQEPNPSRGILKQRGGQKEYILTSMILM